MGSTQVKISGSESGEKLTLVGLEQMDGVGRVIAAFFFSIIGLGLVQTIIFTDLQGSYSAFIDQGDLAERLVTPLMVILISLGFMLLLISFSIQQWLENYISEKLGITGFARLALRIWLLDKVPGFGGGLLILLSWTLSKFILGPLGAILLKSPTGFFYM
jgi:hypothetical protein